MSRKAGGWDDLHQKAPRSSHAASAARADEVAGSPAPDSAPHADHATLSASPSTAEAARTDDPSLASNRAHRPSTQLRDPDRYLIIGEHGRGGLGRVSRAHDRDLGRDVAIKELISRGNISEIRFLREALITARLEHPGIVPVHEAGRWPDGTPFYAMKLVAGRPLRALIAERTTVGERIGLLHHVIAVADAIAYAHGRNIIHRDLKPANVIVGDFGETVVIDWGLAKDLSTTDEPAPAAGPFRDARDNDLTAAGSILGTPAYMAPEQERGENVDQRADVFAIGAMLWELCSLQKVPPTDRRLRHRMLRRAGVDRDLITIIDKALAPEASHRYPDAGALAADLKAFKAGARIAARTYSLFALLAHWTRHHRALAMSLNAAIAIAVVGSVLYVQGITAESVRADAALTESRHERDRAQLSEASLLLEKDPTAAKILLSSLAPHSPQHALLVSRSNHGAAVHTLALIEGIDALVQASDTKESVAITHDGTLYGLTGNLAIAITIDTMLTGAIARYNDEWIYARRSREGKPPTVTTSKTHVQFNTHNLADISALSTSGKSVHALTADGALYDLSQQSPTKLRTGVRRIVENDHTTLICMRDGTLVVVESSTTIVRDNCSQAASPQTMAVSKQTWAAHTSSGHLVYSRNGRIAEIDTGTKGELELATSESGIIALADYENNKSWFIRRDEAYLVAGPSHASPLLSVMTAGSFAAWGYVDGVITVVESVSGATWKLKGHPTGVSYILMNPATGRLVSASTQELRAWDLKSSSSDLVTKMSCNAFNAAPNADGSYIAFDCSDGSVSVWAPNSRAIRQLHKHTQPAFGIAWIGRTVCSGGFDGHIQCSNIDNNTTEDIFPNRGRITWITSDSRQQFAVIASTDGTIWKYDGTLHPLYAHAGAPYRAEISPEGRFVASGSFDGSLIVFDLQRQVIAFRGYVHAGPIRSVEWTDHALWTSGLDGTVKRWDRHGDELQLSSVTFNTGALRLTRTISGGWTSNVGTGAILINRAGSKRVHLNLGRPVNSLAVSRNSQYVAASIAGEIIVIDTTSQAVATIATGSEESGLVAFVSDNALAFGVATSLWTSSLHSLSFFNYQ